MTEKIYEALNRASSLLAEKDLDANAARLLLAFITNRTDANLLANMREPLSDEERIAFWQKTNELLSGKPVQYIIGTEYFYGLPFTVNEHVLIPRPETEELVYGAMQRCQKIFNEQSVKLADVGTGSGAIAVSLKKEWPVAHVTATDISEQALEVAQRNAMTNEVEVRFLQGDMTEPIANEKWDVVLSNPPYIAYHEAQQMSSTVLDHEPHGALFADDNGLFYYRKLIKSLPALMNIPSLIGVEIGYLQGVEVEALFKESFPTAKTEIVKDINGKDRMIFCEIHE